MKLSATTSKLGLIALALSAAYSAGAADMDQDWYSVGKVENPWYVGANVGQSRARIDNDAIANQLLGAGFGKSRPTENNRDTAYKLYSGVQLNKLFALEVGAFDLGRSSFSLNTTPAGTYSGTTALRGLNIDLVASTPVYEKVSAFARVGAQRAESKDNFSGTGFVVGKNRSLTHRETNVKYGLGLQYALNDNLSLRLEAERYRIDNIVNRHGNVDTVTVGLVYRFGGAPARVAVVEPAYVPPPAPMPAPAPVLVVQQQPAPMPPAPRKVSFSADSFFEFGKANVTADGKQALNKFITDLNGADFDTVTVIGHTDRIGAHGPNLKLSERRAQAVKQELVKSSGIAADKIITKGVNGSDPMTKAGECKGNKPTKKLIACLQPDRRVDVEVSGTKQ